MAAPREATEGTGLPWLRLVADLGTSRYDNSPSRFEILRRHFFHLAADEAPDVLSRWECWWLPLEHANVLACGQGPHLGRPWDDLPAGSQPLPRLPTLT